MRPPDPVTALAWFGVLVVLAAVIFWPGRGLLAWARGKRRSSVRVQVEDALKHLLNCELEETPASVVSLAGALEISRAAATALIARLSRSGFAVSEERGLALTADGRAYALRILRTHRLLERFFADRTGLRPADWHHRAEAEEHAVSAAEAEALAARLGDPALDPHGDPIPTAGGRMPPSQGRPLSSLAAGQAATVTHVEDEPEPVYRKLVSLGFHPAVPVKLTGVRDGRLEVLVGGRGIELDRLYADLITVEPVPEAVDHTVLYQRLDVLRPGDTAVVAQIAPAVQGAQRRRLLDLGILPGTDITAEIRSPSGDPIAYRVRGALIALRKAQAQGIYIRDRVHSDGPEAGAAA
ncbi:MAG: metal-dependent transcriptional regulator [Gemmatimonadales bacterium]